MRDPLSSVADLRLRHLLAVNPLALPLELYRSALSGAVPPWSACGVSAGSLLVLLGAGYMMFRSFDHDVADTV